MLIRYLTPARHSGVHKLTRKAAELLACNDNGDSINLFYTGSMTLAATLCILPSAFLGQQKTSVW
jgi:hypothetical protein